VKASSIILLFFITTHASSQSFLDDAVKILKKENYISSILKNKKFQKAGVLTHWSNADTIDFNVVVYSDIFRNELRKRGFLIQGAADYRIDVYAINDTIIFRKITNVSVSKEKGKKFEPELLVIDSQRLKNYVEDHNGKYFSSWTVDDFLNHQFEFRTFGSMCGGDLTGEARSLAKLIKANDTTSIRYLASSFSAEERAYGTAGLYALLARGVDLSDELLNLIVTNQESKNWVLYCVGCIHGTGRMYNVLETKKLSEFYHTLKNFRAL
jgi:hypothetical protein